MASLKYLRNRKRWQCRWHITCADGSIDKGSKCFRHKTDADQYRERVERTEHRLKAGLITPGETIAAAIKLWLAHNQQHTDRTQGHYEYVIERFHESLPKQIANVKHIQAKHCQDYVTALLSGGKTNRTSNSHLTAIKSFCRWFSGRYHIDNPASAVKMLTEAPPASRFLTAEEYVAVLGHAEPPWRDRIIFVGNTGLRATEFCQLRWSCVHDKTITVIGKGRKQRTIPLNQTCRDILKKLRPSKPKPTEYIWFSKNHTPIQRSYFYTACSRIAAAAKIPTFGPHALRHYFGSALLLKGIDIALVSRLLGHSSIRTTETIYIHILPGYLTGLTDVLE